MARQDPTYLPSFPSCPLSLPPPFSSPPSNKKSRWKSVKDPAALTRQYFETCGISMSLCSPCCSLVCRVAMAAQAMSMVTRFDSSFLCRLGASVELLHHLARPSREDAMHRAHSDVCTRHRMPCCTCCSQQIWIDLSLHQVVEARLPAAQASWYDPGEDRTGPNRARYSFNLAATDHLPHTTL